MPPLHPNKLKAIVGEFYLMESRINNRSKKAQKKIQSWKACYNAVDADENYQLQFENLVKRSFFNTVTNAFILVNESYFDRPLKN
jgi:hypothetical protein